jgi:hypothetical protein
MSRAESPVLAFEDANFDVFHEQKQRDSKFNSERLKVKRKLGAMLKRLAPVLAEEGLELPGKTSLSHPWTFNAFKVDSIWGYFSRPEKEKRELRMLFGRALGKDLDPAFTHVLLVIGVGYDGAEVSLKIHQAAWWDGQNLKNRCQDEGDLRRFVEHLNALPGFVLSIHDWRKEYKCGELYRSDLQNYFEYYEPGTHWLHLRLRFLRDDPRLRDERFLEVASDAMRRLVPVYRFVAWSPENNHLRLRT